MNAIMRTTLNSLIIASFCCASAWAASDSWQPAQGPLKTRWAKDVSPANAHPEYPRPQMVREDWLNLNGLWDLAITSKDATRATFETQILVPFPVESALSGVMRPVSENERIWYRRSFEVPAQMARHGGCCCTSARWISRPQSG